MAFTARMLSLGCLVSIAVASVVACGGSEAAGTTSDATPDTNGSDSASDSKSVDAPLDSPIGRVPKNHRPSAVACAPSKGGSTVCSDTGGPPSSCKVDADCKDGTNGHCAPMGGGAFICGCSYDTCANDSECTTGGPCACAGSPYQAVSNGCAPAGNCKVDTDCGATGYCSPSGGVGCSGGLAGYFCHTASDECIEDTDCPTTSGPKACTYDKEKAKWACTEVLACA